MLVALVPRGRGSMHRDIHCHLKASCDFARKLPGERLTLFRGQLVRKRHDDFAGEHCVLALVMLLDAIPEVLTIKNLVAVRQDEAAGYHPSLARVVVHRGGPFVRDADAGAVRRSGRR